MATKAKDIGITGRGLTFKRHFTKEGVHPFDEAGGKTEFGAPAFFEARHLAAIGLVIVSQQVEDAMEHEDGNFLFDGVSEFASLRAGAAERDGEVAEAGTGRGKGEDVRRVVFLAEVAIEAAQFGIAGS